VRFCCSRKKTATVASYLLKRKQKSRDFIHRYFQKKKNLKGKKDPIREEKDGGHALPAWARRRKKRGKNSLPLSLWKGGNNEWGGIGWREQDVNRACRPRGKKDHREGPLLRQVMGAPTSTIPSSARRGGGGGDAPEEGRGQRCARCQGGRRGKEVLLLPAQKRERKENKKKRGGDAIERNHSPSSVSLFLKKEKRGEKRSPAADPEEGLRKTRLPGSPWKVRGIRSLYFPFWRRKKDQRPWPQDVSRPLVHRPGGKKLYPEKKEKGKFSERGR